MFVKIIQVGPKKEGGGGEEVEEDGSLSKTCAYNRKK